MTGEQNYRLLMEMEVNRHFMLMAYRDNPALLARAEPRIRMLFESLDELAGAAATSLDAGNAGTAAGGTDFGA